MRVWLMVGVLVLLAPSASAQILTNEYIDLAMLPPDDHGDVLEVGGSKTVHIPYDLRCTQRVTLAQQMETKGTLAIEAAFDLPGYVLTSATEFDVQTPDCRTEYSANGEIPVTIKSLPGAEGDRSVIATISGILSYKSIESNTTGESHFSTESDVRVVSRTAPWATLNAIVERSEAGWLVHIQTIGNAELEVQINDATGRVRAIDPAQLDMGESAATVRVVSLEQQSCGRFVDVPLTAQSVRGDQELAVKTIRLDHPACVFATESTPNVSPAVLLALVGIAAGIGRRR